MSSRIAAAACLACLPVARAPAEEIPGALATVFVGEVPDYNAPDELASYLAEDAGEG